MKYRKEPSNINKLKKKIPKSGKRNIKNREFNKISQSVTIKSKSISIKQSKATKQLRRTRASYSTASKVSALQIVSKGGSMVQAPRQTGLKVSTLGSWKRQQTELGGIVNAQIVGGGLPKSPRSVSLSKDYNDKKGSSVDSSVLDVNNCSNKVSTCVEYREPVLSSVEEILDEIDKLNTIYKSKSNLETLCSHMNLDNRNKDSVISNGYSLLHRQSLHQDDSFRRILIDFFKGEYRLLWEVAKEYRKIGKDQHKMANTTNDLKELNNYFTSSMQRLSVFQAHLSSLL